MASKRIDININSTNAGGGFKAAGSDIAKLKSEAGSAGQSIGQSISKGTSTATTSMGKLQSVASKTFGTIKAGASAAKDSIGDLGNAISSVAGGLGAMEAIQAMWTGSTQKQFNKAYLQTKMSSQAADEYISTIQKIVAEVPGDDTFMNNLMTGAVAKNTKLTTEELKLMGNVAADYMTVSQSMNKSMIETQADLKEYLLTGNTTQLERDSILKGQIKTLEGQGTIQERILALDKALKAEGYKGLSQLDIASIKWEEIKGKIQLAATTIGEKVLPTVEKLFNFFLDLDTKTNGWSTVLMVAVGTLGLIALALAPIVTAGSAAYVAMKKYRIEAEKAAAANALNKGPGGTAKTAGGTAAGTAGLLGPAVAAGALIAAGIWTGIQAGTDDKVKAQTTTNGIINAFNQSFGQKGAELIGLDAGSDLGQRFAQGWSVAFGVQMQTDMSNTTTYLQGAWGNTLAYLQGAFGNTVAWFQNGFNQISSAVGWVASTIGGSFKWAWDTVVGGYNWMRSIVSRWVSTGISVATGAIDLARAQWNNLRSYIMNNPIVGTIRQITGLGPAGMGAARGPGIGLHYQSYAGHRQNAWNAAGTGLSGNCVDMTLGLMSAYGGSMVSGTWNGGPHVWWQSPSGAQLDPARKALEGTWTPPAKGPGGGNFGNVNIYGDVYGFDDFKRKVEQANASIGYDAGMF